MIPRVVSKQRQRYSGLVVARTLVVDISGAVPRECTITGVALLSSSARRKEGEVWLYSRSCGGLERENGGCYQRGAMTNWVASRYPPTPSPSPP
ncbi:hypothetical protein E2C01_035776 [Portunus trituberculatus]|uniref:Uncharacterized protein n=1 Tax=Portunus trituberculatus TaxID=210409 RepID=A0A5B7F6U2_PORTR|nr:hypothetical protein [Portunus trituberculatus]